MSGHFDDDRGVVAADAWTCAYCGADRDEPCSQFISRASAAERCANLRDPPRPAPTLIQIGPLDV